MQSLLQRPKQRRLTLRRTTYAIQEFTRRTIQADEIVRDGRLDIYPDLVGKDLFRVDILSSGFSIFARGHLGLIPINDRIAIEVTPRVPLSNVEEMLLHASTARPLALTVGFQPLRDSAIRPTAVLDLFAQQLVRLCYAIRDEGFYREYLRKPESGSHPRGRISPFLTARWRARGNPLVASWSAFDRSRDNGPNRIVRAAIDVLLGQYRQMRNRAGARSLAAQLAAVDTFFSDVSSCSVAALLNDPLVKRPDSIPSARPNTRSAVELAKVIVSGRGVELRSSNGSVDLPMLLIDMSDVFEEFGRSVMQAEFRSRGRFVVLDGNVRGATGGQKRFFSSVINADDADRPATPDIVICEVGGRPVLVGDMKYRPYEGKPKREDLDQVLSYSIVYGCKDVLLVYAATRAGAGLLSEYGKVNDVRVHVLVLDLSQPKISQAVSTQAAALHALCLAKFPGTSAALPMSA